LEQDAYFPVTWAEFLVLNHYSEMWFEGTGAASRYKTWTEPHPSHGTEAYWRADARIRVQIS